MVAEALRQHLDVVHLLHGLALILLGAALLLQPKERKVFRYASILWLLGAFAAMHGLEQWLELSIFGDSVAVAVVAALLPCLSLGLLFEFGRRLVRIEGPRDRRPWHHHISAGWLWAIAGAGIAFVLLAVERDPLAGLDLATRYFLGFPGALLAGLGLWLQRPLEPRTAVDRRIDLHLRWAAATFLVWAPVAGLVGTRGSFFPASLLHADALGTWTGLPAELLRAACAVVLLVSFVGLLRVHYALAQGRLRQAKVRAEDSLADVRRLDLRNQWILDAAGQGICGLDRGGNVVFANRVAGELLGRSVDELVGTRLHDAVHGTAAEHASDGCPIEAALAGGTARHGEDEQFRKAGGTGFPVEYTITPRREGGELTGGMIAFRDISERRRVEKDLRQAALIIENTPECVMVTDAEGKIQSVNPAFLQRTGYRREEVLGRTPNLLRSGHHPTVFYESMWRALRMRGHWQGEIWNRRKNGEIYPEWLGVNALRDERGETTSYVAIYSDISLHRDVQQRLHHLAYYDSLTGLPNRQLFSDRLGLALAQARRERRMVGVMFLDLDRFKNINDTLGHSVGDRLLRAVAGRLRGTVRESDTIARIGGDEFTLILSDVQEPAHAATVARKVLDCFVRPLTIEGREFYITGSIGISLYPHDGEDLESLTRKADIAMYRAKELGRNNYQLYRPDMSLRFQQHLTLEADLRRALDRGELALVYQPVVSPSGGQLVGVEALARWRHPELGDIAPSTFIPIAEETGLIARLGEWGLREACREARGWVDQAGGAFRVSVNLSPHQLRQGGLPELVAAVLRDAGLEPSRLALELTESVLMDTSDATATTIQDLVGMGVQIAIDDFGTGYSSLSYLKRFAVDKLKIDPSFVRDIPQDPNDRALAAMIIAMAHASNMLVTAEGVENQEQLEYLKAHGCDEVQGFLFSRPVPAREISRMFAEQVSLA